MPKTGPRLGSRRARTAFFPRRFMACASAIDVVVLPDPAGMPEVAVTRMSLPWGFLSEASFTFALSRP